MATVSVTEFCRSCCANDVVENIAAQVETNPGKNLVKVDLSNCIVTAADGLTHSFEIGSGDREMLLEGLDAIAVTQRRDDEILAFQARDRLKRPWIYLEG